MHYCCYCCYFFIHCLICTYCTFKIVFSYSAIQPQVCLINSDSETH